MTRFLPPHLQELFKARTALEYLAPPERHKSRGYTGVSSFIDRFETPAEMSNLPPLEHTEIRTLAEIREQKRKHKILKNEQEMNERQKAWDPHNNPKTISDAYLTLFVARLSYDVTEEQLRRLFEQIGPVKSLVMVYDLQGKKRGFAFVEMEHERHIREAFNTLNGKKINGRSILVDVERGRTVTDWRPRRLGNMNGTPRVNMPPKGSIVHHTPGAYGRGAPNDRFKDRREGAGGRGGGDRRYGGGYGGDRNRGPRNGGEHSRSMSSRLH